MKNRDRKSTANTIREVLRTRLAALQKRDDTGGLLVVPADDLLTLLTGYDHLEKCYNEVLKDA